MDRWRARLEGQAALDVARLDDALGLALPDRAYVDCLLDPRGHLFQRLEYVGDALLDAVLVMRLVRAQPWDEPSLAFVNGEQQALVSDHALGRVAARRGLPDVRTFAVSRHRLADRIEASIGAAWADLGIDAAEQVALHLVVTPGTARLPDHDGIAGPFVDADEALTTRPDQDGAAGRLVDADAAAATGHDHVGARRAAGGRRYEEAARLCGHDPVALAWYAAAAAGGPPRRRLALVGNAVLEAACATAQYVDDPLATEAQMSEERRVATSNAVLAERAHGLGLVRSGDADDRRSVADEVQALVGAVTMDGGIRAGLDTGAAVLGRTSAPGPVDLLL